MSNQSNQKRRGLSATETGDLPMDIYNLMHEGTVIPAHPLALNAERKLDEARQRQLTRYYIQAGAGGVAVGVHTTQFEIRDEAYQLFEPVLSMAAEEIEKANLSRPFIKVAGICGPTEQAVQEAELACKYGYHLGLLSMGGLADWSDEQLLERTRRVAEVMPVFGFYLQHAVGGRYLSANFWRQMAEIPNVKAIKIAPFNRYSTLDVVRAVCQSSRREDIALYTGNDDNIVLDLLTTYEFRMDGEIVHKQMVGGLLGHWAVWTERAVKLMEEIKQVRKESNAISVEWLTKAMAITDTNAAFFDAQNGFNGCIAGIHEVLRRQGLLAGTWCLNPEEQLSPGQVEEIDRVYAQYPHLNDDDFVHDFLNRVQNG